jgi:hypothetical protein
MAGKSADNQRLVSKLPPPPAPTSRDANPWPMPERSATPGQAPKASLRRPGRGKDVLGKGPKGSGVGPMAGLPGPRKRLALLPLIIVAAFIAFALKAARESIAAGDLPAAIIPLVISCIVAIGYFRASRARRTRGQRPRS